jgi:signal transduction histidine kinase
MELARRSVLVYVFLAAIWLLVVGWQVQEHRRVTEAAKADLRTRSKDIAKTVSAFIRGLRFRGTVLQERLEPVLSELVNGRTNELISSSELIGIKLLNAAGEQVASAGVAIDLDQRNFVQQGERWGRKAVVLLNPVDLGAALTSEGVTNPTVVLPPRERSLPRHEPRPGESGPVNPESITNSEAGPPRPPDGGGERDGRRRDGPGRSRRPPWLRGMDEAEYQSMVEKRSLHGLALAMSTESFQSVATRDRWQRSIIVLLATISVIGSGLAWRNLAKSAELQIRLVRASELNTHLKEMNLAAAGLAHETRNPLNIIRGLAQMMSRRNDASPEIREKTRDIIDETDKVTAQLNEFINYSRPREVRRTTFPISSVLNEVVRALNFDLEEKQIKLELKGDAFKIEADEQLLRQALFNLLLNAVQVADGDGRIEVFTQKRTASEAVLEVRDNGPGVSPDHREEIFKPYFTTQKQGTGLGLAVVQQIVLAHGWEIECLPNEPRGAVFRITHLKVAG